MKQWSLDLLQAHVGKEVGVSDWIMIDQGRIDRFAEVTMDDQYIHVDPERAAMSPFGGTIAHGYLTLSLLSKMAELAVPTVEGASMAVNYGFNSVRFLAPVRAGKRVRGRFLLTSIMEKGARQALLTLSVTIEIEGEDKPALVAEWLIFSVQ